MLDAEIDTHIFPCDNDETALGPTQGHTASLAVGQEAKTILATRSSGGKDHHRAFKALSGVDTPNGDFGVAHLP